MSRLRQLQTEEKHEALVEANAAKAAEEAKKYAWVREGLDNDDDDNSTNPLEGKGKTHQGKESDQDDEDDSLSQFMKKLKTKHFEKGSSASQQKPLPKSKLLQEERYATKYNMTYLEHDM